MHADRVIPDGCSGRTAKITIQGYRDRRPFIYFAMVLHEDNVNLYARMGRNEIIFRKQHIHSIEFLKKSKGALSKLDPGRTDRGNELKIIYKTGQKTQVCVGKVTESESYYYVELDDHRQRIIMKNCVLSIKDVKRDKSGRKSDWTDKHPGRKKADGFSYGKWWHHLDVKEAENK